MVKQQTCSPTLSLESVYHSCVLSLSLLLSQLFFFSNVLSAHLVLLYSYSLYSLSTQIGVQDSKMTHSKLSRLFMKLDPNHLNLTFYMKVFYMLSWSLSSVASTTITTTAENYLFAAVLYCMCSSLHI